MMGSCVNPLCNNMKKAALYLRSSKDRAEVGTDSQRKELLAFAVKEDLTVADEFSDMELSGSFDETSRPGFKRLLAAVREKKFDVVLAVDTSRIARDPMVSMFFTRECEKSGVDLRYSKLGIDSQTAMGEMVLGVLRQFDRLHARLSADKGRAGQEANLSRGFRAGGRAPIGYKLHHEETGASRGGVAVRKSKLVTDPALAPRVTAFLKARALGVPRTAAARLAKMEAATASLVGIEKNALTYSGALVWNRSKKHRASREDPRQTMLPRPREEWIIEENKHPAMITRAEAERIIEQVTHRPKTNRVAKPLESLLTGLLVSPDGPAWHYDGSTKSYRAGKGKRVNAEWLDGEVLSRIAYDSSRADFVTSVINAARRQARAIISDPKVIDGQLRDVQAKLKRLTDAVAAGNGFSSLRERMAELETEQTRLLAEKGQCAQRAGIKASLLDMTPDHVRWMLSLEAMGAPSLQGEQRQRVRERLSLLLECISLDPSTRELRLHYRFTGVKVASPRGFEPRLPP